MEGTWRLGRIVSHQDQGLVDCRNSVEARCSVEIRVVEAEQRSTWEGLGNSEVERCSRMLGKKEADNFQADHLRRHFAVELETGVADNLVVGWGYHTALAVAVDYSMGSSVEKD